MKPLAALAALVLSVLLAWPTEAFASAGQSSFTPDSLVVNVSRVVLASPRGPDAKSVNLYECNGAASECLVDLADQAALDALFSKPVPVPVGTYDSVRIYTADAVLRVKGKVDLGARDAASGIPDPQNVKTFRTVAGPEVLSDTPGTPEYAEVPLQEIPLSRLAKPLEVREGEVVDLSALFTLRDIAWAFSVAADQYGQCRKGSGGAAVCVGLPALAVFPRTDVVTLEAYLISERMGEMNDATPIEDYRAFAGGQIIFLVGPDGEPFAGWLRSYYSATSKRPNSIFHGRLRFVLRNPAGADADSGTDAATIDTDAGDAGTDDGGGDASVPDASAAMPPLPAGAASYQLQDFGYRKAEDDPDTASYRLRIERFYRADHKGVMLQDSAASATYYAFKR